MPALSDRPASALLSAEADPITAYDGAVVFRVREPSSPHSRVRPRRTSTRPTSYYQILEGFEGEGSASGMDRQDSQQSADTVAGSPSASQIPLSSDNTDIDLGKDDDEVETSISSVQVSPRREDTARRSKRFSLPAVALQTSPVVTKQRSAGEGRSKRFSLVLGGRNGTAKRKPKSGTSQDERDLSKGVAVSKLQELLKSQA